MHAGIVDMLVLVNAKCRQLGRSEGADFLNGFFAEQRTHDYLELDRHEGWSAESPTEAFEGKDSPDRQRLQASRSGRVRARQSRGTPGRRRRAA